MERLRVELPREFGDRLSREAKTPAGDCLAKHEIVQIDHRRLMRGNYGDFARRCRRRPQARCTSGQKYQTKAATHISAAMMARDQLIMPSYSAAVAYGVTES